MYIAVAFNLHFNKQSFPEDQKNKTAILASLTDKSTMIHTLNPSNHNDIHL